MDPKTDLILTELVAAQDRLTQARQEWALTEANLLAERDALIVRARKTGTGPTELARLTGMERNAIYKALARAGLK